MAVKKNYKNLKQFHQNESDHTLQLISPPLRRSMETTMISRRSRSVGMENSSAFYLQQSGKESDNVPSFIHINISYERKVIEFHELNEKDDNTWLDESIKATSTPIEESSGPVGDSMRLQFHYGETMTGMIFNQAGDPKYRLGPIFVNGEKYVKECVTPPSLLIATPKMLTFETGRIRRDLTLFNSSESSMAAELRGVNAQKYKMAIGAAILGPASLVKIPIERITATPLMQKFVYISSWSSVKQQMRNWPFLRCLKTRNTVNWKSI